MKTLQKIPACICAALMILTACATIQAAPVAPTIASLATLAPTETSVSTPGPGRLETGEITSQALAGNLLGDPATRKFQVYLPSGYDTSNDRYPVVYVLHLYPGDYMSFSGQTPRSLETLIAGDKVEPMILVFPDAYNKLGGSMYWSSPTIGDYETYITRELVQQIDATYRTLPGRESRGVMGCSMGGTGALHLGLKYPDVFSVVAPMSASTYDWQHDPVWGTARDSLFFLPPKIEDLKDIPFAARFIIAAAAATAPNPDKPPFYLDMPFQFVDGRPQIVSKVFRKENALDPINDVRRYIAQPIKLRGLLIYNDTDNGDYQEEVDFVPRSVGRFCETLTRLGVPHQCAMVNASHCGYDFSPVLEFMGAHLTY